MKRKRTPRRRGSKKVTHRNPMPRTAPWEALGKRRNPEPSVDPYLPTDPEIEAALARQNPLPEKWGPELYNPLESKDFVQEKLPEVLRNPRGHLYDGSLYTSIFSRNPVPQRAPLNDPGGIYTPIYNRNPDSFDYSQELWCGQCDGMSNCSSCRALRISAARALREEAQMRAAEDYDPTDDYHRNPDFFQNDDNWTHSDYRWLDSLLDE